MPTAKNNEPPNTKKAMLQLASPHHDLSRDNVKWEPPPRTAMNEPPKTVALTLAAPRHMDDDNHDPSFPDGMRRQPRSKTTLKKKTDDGLAPGSPGAWSAPNSPRLDDGSPPSGGGSRRRRTTLREKLSKAGMLPHHRTHGDVSTHRKSDPKAIMEGKEKEADSRGLRLASGSSSSSPPSSTNKTMVTTTSSLNTTTVGAIAIPGINSSSTTATMTTGQHPEQKDTIVLPAAIPIDEEEARLRTTSSMVDRMGEKIKQEVQAQLAAQRRTPATRAEVQKSTRTSNQSSTSLHLPDQREEEQQQEQRAKSNCTYSRWSIISVIVVLLILAGIVTGVILSLKSKDDETTVVDSSSSTSAPIVSQQAQEWLEILKPWIVPSEDDQLAFQDATSPQSLAIEWLSTGTISRDLNQSSQQQLILERYVLAVLFFATKGSEWNLRENTLYLNDTSSSCHWNNGVAWEANSDAALGVYCAGENATVTHLALQRVGLSGSLPWELSLLSDLVTLQLNDNALRGTLPTNLYKLSNLQYLILSSNSLTGRLPDRLPSSIRTVDLSTNAISGKIPGSIFGSQLFNLANLHLENNNFSGQLPSELGHAIGMTLLAIDHNALMGTIPTELGLLTNLSALWLDANDLTGSIPLEFAQLTQLESLTFQKNLLTGTANDALCSSNRLWTTLEGDCLLDENGQVEMECTCCTACCNDDTSFCQ